MGGVDDDLNKFKMAMACALTFCTATSIEGTKALHWLPDRGQKRRSSAVRHTEFHNAHVARLRGSRVEFIASVLITKSSWPVDLETQDHRI